MEGDENMKWNRKESLHMHGRQTLTGLKAEYFGEGVERTPRRGRKSQT
jgi:hypothetical protein